MFSRSEKTEEVNEAMSDPTGASGERSPMVLAALAGLLAIAGAFLLVWYLGNDSDSVAGGTTSSAANGSGGSSSGTATGDKKPVLVATRAIPRGTSIRELRDAPTVYLTSDLLDEDSVISSAIASVPDLRDASLDNQVLAADVLPGEQLLRDRFRNPSEFDTDETFLEASTGIDAPENHHSVVIELPAFRAMGGNIRAGENVTVVGNFNVVDDAGERYEQSIVVFNSVEVLSVESSLEVLGSLANEVDQVGIANRGSYTITLAVEPDELTDLTYAMEWGDLILATAVEGFDNENDPRAVTNIDGIVGDDGVWLAEIEDGNLVDLLGFLANGEVGAGSSIEVEIESDDDGPGPAPVNEELEEDPGAGAELVDDPEQNEPGDS